LESTGKPSVSAIDSLSERKREIIELLAANTGLSIADLARTLHVSAVTVRHDLASLEEEGYLVRTRGGALPTFHSSILERQRYRVEEKNRIAKAAAEMVRDGDTIMIEAGTTTALVAKYLLGKRDIHIVTNSTLILPYARFNPAVHLTATGGAFRSFTESFVGPVAIETLQKYHVHLAFVGTDGFGLDHGLTTHLAEGAEIVRHMCRQAEDVVLVADSSKYGRVGFARVVGLEEMGTVVTDEGLDIGDAVRVSQAAGVRVLRV
jgi:DeoR family galactitol utilization operon repressor